MLVPAVLSRQALTLAGTVEERAQHNFQRSRQSARARLAQAQAAPTAPGATTASRAAGRPGLLLQLRRCRGEACDRGARRLGRGEHGDRVDPAARTERGAQPVEGEGDRGVKEQVFFRA